MMLPVIEICDCTFTLDIPQGCKILVAQNDEVEENKLLASQEQEEFEEIDLATALSIPPKKIAKSLMVSLGNQVEKGQIIASRKPLLGKEVNFKSPVSGALVEVSEKGILRIRIKSRKKEIRSPFKGKIKLVGEDSLVLEFQGEKINGSGGRGPKVLGDLEILGEREGEVKLSDLGTKQEDKIIIIGGKITLGILNKAEALGIKGLVGNYLCQEITPNELAIVALGEKDEYIPEAIWKELKKKGGEKAIVSGEEKFLIFPLK